MKASAERSFAELVLCLDPKEAAFVELYLECLNATRAARRIWRRDKNPAQKGYQVMHRPDVHRAIRAGLRERGGIQQVTERFSRGSKSN